MEPQEATAVDQGGVARKTTKASASRDTRPAEHGTGTKATTNSSRSGDASANRRRKARPATTARADAPGAAQADTADAASTRKRKSQAGASASREKRQRRLRTSQVLRQILTKNPSKQEFTIEHIVQSMQEGGLAQPMLLFSVPGILPVPEMRALAGLPASAVAGHMIIGRSKIELPPFIRERSVPRRSLAVAIHAVIPILERLEKATKKRWLWMSHPIAQRMVGVLLFVLAVSVAFPLVGFTLPHAAAMFTIAFGVAEQDGLAILLGVAAGVAALVLVSGRDLTFGALRSRIWKWIRGLARRFAGTVLGKLGFDWAHVLGFDWSHLLLLWNPENALGLPKGPTRRGALPPAAPVASGAVPRRRAPIPTLVPV